MLGDGNIDKAKEPRVLRRLPRADEFARAQSVGLSALFYDWKNAAQRNDG